MNLGFYYHIPLHSALSGLRIPAYLGVFLDSLAEEVDTLTLFMHEAKNGEIAQCDYLLKNTIKYISLGPKTPAWDRFLWPKRTIRKIKGAINECDCLLVRAPSPLAPAFFNEFHTITKIAYLIVGDYVDGIKHQLQPWWRKWPSDLLIKRNDLQLNSATKLSITLVNSTELYHKYKDFAPLIYEVKTTTLLENDFFERKDTCANNEIKILYSGGLYLKKGLLELVEACSELINLDNEVSLHFVGGETDPDKPVERVLLSRARDLQIDNKVFFHGYRTTGPALNEMYRISDIYAIPSYHEGFPRTIWEAMANSLPVVATKVGSIPYFLKDGEDALLVEPKNVQELTNALVTLIQNSKTRQKLIHNGFLLAKKNTLEIQTKFMMDILRTT